MCVPASSHLCFALCVAAELRETKLLVQGAERNATMYSTPLENEVLVELLAEEEREAT